MTDSVLIKIQDPCLRLDWRTIFGQDHPVELDLGAGDGGFALAYAQQHPEINLLAVERLLGRIRKIEKRAQRQPLGNVRGLRLELGYTVRYLLPANSVAIAHLMFPDPWPKRRHWDRRLVQPPFVRDLLAALQPGGELRFTTDHVDYFGTAQEAVAEVPEFQHAGLWKWELDPKTDFQRGFDAEGRATYRARWVKALS